MIAAQRSLNRLWGSDWPAIASQWGLDGSIFHFNHGAYGAVPKVVRDQQKSHQEQIDQNPSGFFRRELEPLLESARLEMAAFCRASPDGFALVRNASEGMTIALAGVPLSTGQEVIITSHVYPSVRFAVEDKCKETGAKLLEVHLSCSDDDSELIAPILGAITEKTRLIVIDEIPWTTGCLFPVRKLSRELSKVVGENGIALLVDGAHAPGTYPLSVEALGADIWVGNFHKWVCAPHGAGAIWSAPAWRNRLRPSYVSFRDRLSYPHCFGRLGSDDLTGILCVPFAIQFLKEIGFDKIYSYNTAVAAHGAEVITHALETEKIAGRFASRHPIALPPGIATDPTSALGLQTQIAKDLRAELSVVSPVGPETQGSIVISAFIYNHPDDYEEFGHLLKQYLRRQLNN